MDNIVTPHDLFFKKFLVDTSVATELIKKYLPEAIVSLVDFNTLKQVSASFVDKKLKHKESDVLLQANILDTIAYFYFLFEHQSTPEFTMPMRSASYLLKIMERHHEQHKSKKVPYIYPIVFYNGTKPYPYATDIREMLDAPDSLVASFRLGRFHLIDLNEVDDEQLRESTWLNLCCFAMKHAHDTDFDQIIEHIINQLERINDTLLDDDIETRQLPLLYYIISAYRKLDREKFMSRLHQSKSEDLKKAGLTLADQFREEGLQRGRREGRHKERQHMVQNMLGKGLSVEYVSEMTGLSKKEILAYAQQLVNSD